MGRGKITLILLVLGVFIAATGCKNNSESSTISAADSAKIAQAKADSLARIKEEKRLAEEEAKALAEKEEAMRAQQQREKMKFHVIIGGFVIQSNADGYLERMRATYSDAKIFIAPNGFKLVSIGDFETYNQALAMIRGIWNSEGGEERTDLWVYEEGGRYDTSSWLETRGEADAYDSYDSSPSQNSNMPVDEFDM